MYTKASKSSAFTLVEMIVSISILTILATIWFYTFTDNIPASRDVQRLSDIAKVETALQLYKQNRWAYPAPWNTFNITNNWQTVARQWYLNTNVRLSTLESLPSDPYAKVPYVFSVNSSRSEYQLGASLENIDSPEALISWNYSTVAKNVLPTIILAIQSTTDVEIREWVWSWSTNRELFIFNKSRYNYPYAFKWEKIPQNAWKTFAQIVSEAESNNFWQNSDFHSCVEIYEARRSIWDWEYQIVNRNTGSLTSTGCTSM